MSSNQELSAMRRKAGAGRPPPEIGQLTPGRALRAAVAQAAQDVAGLVAVAGNVDEARVTRDPLIQALPDQPLLGLVEGPDSRFGLLVLDGQTVAALIEMQTTGRVVPRSADPRAPTRTDAIMCADFIDRVLELVEAQVVEAELPLATVFSGFRYAMALAEPRAIAMTLDDVPYRSLSLAVDFSHGAKSGQITLILPFDPPGQRRSGGADSAAFSEALRAQVLETEVCLAATLARREMTVAQVTRLEVGAVIALPREVLEMVEVEDLHGQVVARGRLGQADGMRAVRLVADTPPGAGEARAGPGAPVQQQIAPPDMGGLEAFAPPDPLPDIPGLGGEASGLGMTDPLPEPNNGFADLPDPDMLAGLGDLSGGFDDPADLSS